MTSNSQVSHCLQIGPVGSHHERSKLHKTQTRFATQFNYLSRNIDCPVNGVVLSTRIQIHQRVHTQLGTGIVVNNPEIVQANPTKMPNRRRVAGAGLGRSQGPPISERQYLEAQGGIRMSIWLTNSRVEGFKSSRGWKGVA